MKLVFEPGAYLACGISIGNLVIRFYALCILFGMILAVIISLRESKKLGTQCARFSRSRHPIQGPDDGF